MLMISEYARKNFAVLLSFILEGHVTFTMITL